MKPIKAVAVPVLLAPPAAARQQSTRPHPADPAVPIPATKHQSAFAGYPGFREEPLASWRDVNDEVARIGGHVSGAHGACGASAGAGARGGGRHAL